jgi:hypothetical protein
MLAMQADGVILHTKELVKVRAEADSLIVLHAVIGKSPILKVAMAAPVLGVPHPPFKINRLE